MFWSLAKALYSQLYPNNKKYFYSVAVAQLRCQLLQWSGLLLDLECFLDDSGGLVFHTKTYARSIFNTFKQDKFIVPGQLFIVFVDTKKEKLWMSPDFFF